MCCFNFKKFVKKCLDGYLQKNNKANKKSSLVVKNLKAQKYKGVYTSYGRCGDNYVGDISCRSPNLFILPEFRFNNKHNLTIKRKTEKNKIVILLESPHRHEYTPKSYRACTWDYRTKIT